jgi:hypothetical protein
MACMFFGIGNIARNSESDIQLVVVYFCGNTVDRVWVVMYCHLKKEGGVVK